MNARALGYLLCMVLVAQTVTYSVTLAAVDIPAGKAIYERLCVSCHGLDGRGGRMAGMLPVPPRNLLDQTYMQSRSDQQLFEVISQGSAAVGLSSAMSGFGTQLTAPEIRDTIAYIRTLTAPGTAASASETVLQSTKGASTDLHIARLRLSIWPNMMIQGCWSCFAAKWLPLAPFLLASSCLSRKGQEKIGAVIISERNELLIHPHQICRGRHTTVWNSTYQSHAFSSNSTTIRMTKAPRNVLPTPRRRPILLRGWKSTSNNPSWPRILPLTLSPCGRNRTGKVLPRTCLRIVTWE